jgi:REP element-mobilizing transposase RayT
MPKKYQNKYRISSARAPFWDYSHNAAYFVTICTKNREWFFGDVVDGDMVLSEIGKIANDYWLAIPEHFPFVKLGAHIIMPNHVHGIIIIDKPYDGYIDEHNVETPNLGVSITNPVSFTNPTSQSQQNPASTANSRLPKTNPGGKNKKWKPGTLGVILNQYKRICTINARKIHADFEWQPRFHDRIIRDEKSFQTISAYIINNPKNWATDNLNKRL